MKRQTKSQRKSIAIEKIAIPLRDIQNISEETRYSYYLLGHIFNELMCLQKLICFTLPQHNDTRDIRYRPEMAQAIFLFRTAASKVAEVKKELRENPALKSTLNELILPKWEDGNRRRIELDAAIDNAKWLSTLRNKIGFHFPNLNQLREYIKPTADWEEDYVYISKESGNVFYDAANTVIIHWMFSKYNSSDAVNATDPMITEMIEIIKLTTAFIEDALGVLICEEIISDRNIRTPSGTVVAPRFSDVHIPFWTRMPKPSDTH